MPKLHILANPYGITDKKYQMEPFGVAITKFIKNMKLRGYSMIHYGHALSSVDCEHVTVITEEELTKPMDTSELFWYNERLMKIYNSRVDAVLNQTKTPGDLVLCYFGIDHKPAVQNHTDLIIVEPNIGYRTSCVFAPYRAFTSYAQMHYYYGSQNMLMAPSWYDAVIPNAITHTDFEMKTAKQDYLLYLGRISPDKGIELAIQVAEYTKKKLLIAGPGDLASIGYPHIPDHAELVGYADLERRKQLMADASALIAPTYYIEPFGNVVVEAQMSGTPVITTDWGGFVDNVKQGVTGFRCKDFRSFTDAVNGLSELNPEDCRRWAVENFSDDPVHDLYDQWFKKIIRNDFYSQ
jgi:glycosyltransferase involved in cell wall biosynthesis